MRNLRQSGPRGARKGRLSAADVRACAVEPKWEVGRINVLLGEGQTAQVLRNLCYLVYQSADDPKKSQWTNLVAQIRALFGVSLREPVHVAERGEIVMQYDEANGTRLDLSSAGRGLQQTLLLLTHLYANPGTVLLLDEPDAHLEILRQRQIYQLLTDLADQQGFPGHRRKPFGGGS